MSKTKPNYRETKFGVLPISEIEAIITDNLINVSLYILRNYQKLTIDIKLIKDLHAKLANNLYQEAGDFRKREVQLGNFEPPKFFKIPELIKNWEDDFKERSKFIKSIDDHVEILAWLMHRFLWIHPFFDYNGRISRLLGEIYLLQNNLPINSFKGIKRNQFALSMKEATINNGNLSGVIKIIKRGFK